VICACCPMEHTSTMTAEDAGHRSPDGAYEWSAGDVEGKPLVIQGDSKIAKGSRVITMSNHLARGVRCAAAHTVL